MNSIWLDFFYIVVKLKFLGQALTDHHQDLKQKPEKTNKQTKKADNLFSNKHAYVLQSWDHCTGSFSSCQSWQVLSDTWSKRQALLHDKEQLCMALYLQFDQTAAHCSFQSTWNYLASIGNCQKHRKHIWGVGCNDALKQISYGFKRSSKYKAGNNPMTQAVCVCIFFFFQVNYNSTITYNTVTHQLRNSSVEWMWLMFGLAEWINQIFILSSRDAHGYSILGSVETHLG